MRTHQIQLGRALLVAMSCWLASCASSEAPPPVKAAMPSPKVVATQQGIASLYTDRRTASGERFNGKALTAAHRTWPMGSKVRVTNRNSGRSVIVRINDRGPYVRGRIIDLTPAAAEAIGLTWKMGLARVTLERLE
jgi:rare lipoprotein A